MENKILWLHLLERLRAVAAEFEAIDLKYKEYIIPPEEHIIRSETD